MNISCFCIAIRAEMITYTSTISAFEEEGRFDGSLLILYQIKEGVQIVMTNTINIIMTSVKD